MNVGNRDSINRALSFITPQPNVVEQGNSAGNAPPVAVGGLGLGVAPEQVANNSAVIEYVLGQGSTTVHSDGRVAPMPVNRVVLGCSASGLSAQAAATQARVAAAAIRSALLAAGCAADDFHIAADERHRLQVSFAEKPTVKPGTVKAIAGRTARAVVMHLECVAGSRSELSKCLEGNAEVMQTAFSQLARSGLLGVLQLSPGPSPVCRFAEDAPAEEVVRAAIVLGNACAEAGLGDAGLAIAAALKAAGPHVKEALMSLIKQGPPEMLAKVERCIAFWSETEMFAARLFKGTVDNAFYNECRWAIVERRLPRGLDRFGFDPDRERVAMPLRALYETGELEARGYETREIYDALHTIFECGLRSNDPGLKRASDWAKRELERKRSDAAPEDAGYLRNLLDDLERSEAEARQGAGESAALERNLQLAALEKERLAASGASFAQHGTRITLDWVLPKSGDAIWTACLDLATYADLARKAGRTAEVEAIGACFRLHASSMFAAIEPALRFATTGAEPGRLAVVCELLLGGASSLPDSSREALLNIAIEVGEQSRSSRLLKCILMAQPEAAFAQLLQRLERAASQGAHSKVLRICASLQAHIASLPLDCSRQLFEAQLKAATALGDVAILATADAGSHIAPLDQLKEIGTALAAIAAKCPPEERASRKWQSKALDCIQKAWLRQLANQAILRGPVVVAEVLTMTAREGKTRMPPALREQLLAQVFNGLACENVADGYEANLAAYCKASGQASSEGRSPTHAVMDLHREAAEMLAHLWGPADSIILRCSGHAPAWLFGMQLRECLKLKEPDQSKAAEKATLPWLRNLLVDMRQNGAESMDWPEEFQHFPHLVDALTRAFDPSRVEDILLEVLQDHDPASPIGLLMLALRHPPSEPESVLQFLEAADAATLGFLMKRHPQWALDAVELLCDQMHPGEPLLNKLSPVTNLVSLCNGESDRKRVHAACERWMETHAASGKSARSGDSVFGEILDRIACLEPRECKAEILILHRLLLPRVGRLTLDSCAKLAEMHIRLGQYGLANELLARMIKRGVELEEATAQSLKDKLDQNQNHPLAPETLVLLARVTRRPRRGGNEPGRIARAAPGTQV